MWPKDEGEEVKPSCVGLKPDTPPSLSKIGVSTTYVPNFYAVGTHWFALRTTYGQEKKAYDYLVEHECECYLPTLTEVVLEKGKRVKKTVSRLPNIFFAHGTFNQLKEFVYDNVHLPFLRFYYEGHHNKDGVSRIPLIVPDHQIESLRIICEAESADVLMVPGQVKNFEEGERVLITDGSFKGIEGRVARWHGQQRVGVIIEHLCTIATAYIPSAFLEPINENKQRK